MSLKDKVAIATVGNSGIGQAIVLELARQGANVAIEHVCHPEADALDRKVGELGDRSIGIEADASKLAATTIIADGGIMEGSVGP